MASISCRHIYKIYPGNVTAVKDFNLEIADKEFIVFVGPSGCGKSTTLRMVAGLEEISKGEMYIGDRLIKMADANHRPLGSTETCNKRTINQFIHPDVLMGIADLTSTLVSSLIRIVGLRLTKHLHGNTFFRLNHSRGQAT